jgi:putative hydrolase of the HAD superfamily
MAIYDRASRISTFMVPSLVVFDLGRVLVRICRDWRQACEVAGVDVSRFKEPDEAGRATLHDLVCASEVGQLDFDGFCTRAGDLFGVEPAAVACMSNNYLRGTYPGANELLEELRRRSIDTACLSNTNENHWRIMTSPPMDQTLSRLKYHFPSQLCRLRKPDPAIFRHVERATGHKPAEIVFFDDVEENVTAARGCGWMAEVVRFDGDDDRHDPITQVRAHLARLGVQL